MEDIDLSVEAIVSVDSERVDLLSDKLLFELYKFRSLNERVIWDLNNSC